MALYAQKEGQPETRFLVAGGGGSGGSGGAGGAADITDVVKILGGANVQLPPEFPPGPYVIELTEEENSGGSAQSSDVFKTFTFDGELNGEREFVYITSKGNDLGVAPFITVFVELTNETDSEISPANVSIGTELIMDTLHIPAHSSKSISLAAYYDNSDEHYKGYRPVWVNSESALTSAGEFIQMIANGTLKYHIEVTCFGNRNWSL